MYFYCHFIQVTLTNKQRVSFYCLSLVRFLIYSGQTVSQSRRFELGTELTHLTLEVMFALLDIGLARELQAILTLYIGTLLSGYNMGLSAVAGPDIKAEMR